MLNEKRKTENLYKTPGDFAACLSVQGYPADFFVKIFL